MDKQVALNLGCHDIKLPGFINIDLDPNMHPDLLWDCTKLLDRFPEGSISCINAGHFLEHVKVPVGMQIVKDCYKLLTQFGYFVATCPDYTKLEGKTIEEKERIIMAEGDHLVLMDGPRMERYFKEAGFQSVIITTPDKWGLCPFPGVEWQTVVIGLKHEV